MRTPLKLRKGHQLCLGVLKSKIPVGAVIDSFLFFSGELEFGLASSNRFVSAHTNRFVIYEFWTCMNNDSKVVHDLVCSESYQKFRNKNALNILQENWFKYDDPYVRSALFFILNSHSASGQLTSGEYDESNFNPVSLVYLKDYQQNNFHINYHANADLISMIKNNVNGEYLLLPMTKFNYNLFEQGKSLGLEQTRVNHQHVENVVKSIDRKWIILYENHSSVLSKYKDFNITMVNKYGQVVNSQQECEEIIVTNF